LEYMQIPALQKSLEVSLTPVSTSPVASESPVIYEDVKLEKSICMRVLPKHESLLLINAC
jgi:hypothetical protein